MSYLTRWQRPELSNWESLGHLSSLRDEIERFFEAPLAALASPTHLLSGWSPSLDVYENKETVTVKAELPGMKKEDIEITLHDGMLSISGERKTRDEHKDAEVYRSETFVGRFQRSVGLPAPVSSDKVKAQYKDGVLTVTLPKTEEAKPKQIEVSVS